MQGEGEVKILNRLVNNWQPFKPEDSHAILGNDSDLMLMAMVRCSCSCCADNQAACMGGCP